MNHLNVEFKARCADLDAVRATLRQLGAAGPTVDHQIDTYFTVPNGRLKLREGNVERALIQYHRPDHTGPKTSDVTLVPMPDETAALNEALTRALGVDIVVDKLREIWWLDNVKLHVDCVNGLGTFIEVEAIACEGLSERELRGQCDRLLEALGVKETDLVATSYSNMIMSVISTA